MATVKSSTDPRRAKINKVVRNQADKKVLGLLGAEGVNFITEDCGDNFRVLSQGRVINELQFHPRVRGWALATSWSRCEDYVETPCVLTKELYVTKDLGYRWELVTDYIVQFAWAAVSENVPKERIFLTHEPKGKGNQQIAGWSEAVHFSMSDDFFKTSKILVPRGNKFLLNPTYIFVAQVVDQSTQDVNLIVASSTGPEYEFDTTELPSKIYREHSYTILDASESSVFLNINHQGANSKFGNVYISDAEGVRYSLSLRFQVRNSDGQCDFERVQGLEGIYLANVYDEQAIKNLKYKLQAGMDAAETGPKRGGASFSAFDNLEAFKRTLITFDKGGIWKPLTPPEKDSTGRRTICDSEGCSLHLHSLTSKQFGPFYSTENSLGIVMGTGNVGQFLTSKIDQVNTYLSRDGGYSWFEVRKGSHIYEIGDHGGLIVMAPDQEATNSLLYSWNEGLTWDQFNFTNDTIEVTNIMIEPSNVGQKFVLYGETTLNKKRKGVVVALDFSTLHQRTCKGANSPDASDSDYEKWNPYGESLSKCLMGRQITYIRRKREAECFNGIEFDRPEHVKNCECTEADWECDADFERPEGGGPCARIDGTDIDYKPPLKCDGYYYVSQGYRKVAGDTCQGGVDHSPLKLPCPGITVLNKSSYGVIIVLILIIVLLVLIKTNSTILGSGNKQDNRGYIKYGMVDKMPAGEMENFGKLVFEDEDLEDQPAQVTEDLSLIHISEPTRLLSISYAVFCLKKKKRCQCT
eukprot:TRINITY_DN3020_c0_g1_i4.p1 TRINITY_DN3020_c0_g1~~TRINITY_DN3020_c0_g1_i4.p1  ORF type:complete len:750 (-),score=167.04 TRINITY_DN3020_c0_g1_i4:24-2273(-)